MTEVALQNAALGVHQLQLLTLVKGVIQSSRRAASPNTPSGSRAARSRSAA